MLKRSAIGISGASVAGLAGCLGGDDGVVTLASSFEEGHILVETANELADQVEDETDNDIEIDVVPGGAYGAEDEIADQLQDGIVEMQAVGGMPYSVFAPEYYFFDNPLVIEDLDHLRRVEESDKFEEGREQVAENGNQRQVGSFVYRGYRQFTANEPVTEPADLEGIDLRLPELDSWVTIWEEIGASPTAVALDELYSALEQGVADASEGDAEQIHSMNLNEVQEYVSLTEHQVQTGGLYINDDYFEGLDEAHQDAILEIAADITQEASERAEDEEAELLAGLEEEGMEVIDEVNHDAFAEAAEPAIENLFENEWEGTWDEWRSI